MRGRGPDGLTMIIGANHAAIIYEIGIIDGRADIVTMPEERGGPIALP